MLPTWRLALALGATASLSLAACSGTSATTSTTLTQAQSVTEITRLFTTVFTGAGDVSHKVALVQDGGSIKAALVSGFSSPQWRSSSIRVNQIDLLTRSDCKANGVGYPCARVTNDILVNGQPILRGEKSYAVLVGRQWKVAKLTMCDLLGPRSGAAPAGC